MVKDACKDLESCLAQRAQAGDLLIDQVMIECCIEIMEDYSSIREVEYVMEYYIKELL